MSDKNSLPPPQFPYAPQRTPSPALINSTAPCQVLAIFPSALQKLSWNPASDSEVGGRGGERGDHLNRIVVIVLDLP